MSYKMPIFNNQHFCFSDGTKMTDLPKAKVMPDKAPFTDVGVDYFGPIGVNLGRSHLKDIHFSSSHFCSIPVTRSLFIVYQNTKSLKFLLVLDLGCF